jgi:hypothetical protein
MEGVIYQLGLAYGSFKHDLSVATGASEDLLHVHAGLLIYGLAALLLRHRLHSIVPLALVVGFACANEIVDLLSPIEASGFESLADITNTVFWPTVLFLLARRSRPAPVPAPEE